MFTQLLVDAASEEVSLPVGNLHAPQTCLEDLRALSPEAFESWVGDRFRERGYLVRETGSHGKGGDHGIDLVVEKPGERAVVQCKNFRAWAVGEPSVRDLFGAMHAADVDRSYLVTTGRVTGPAWTWAAGKPIEIWDHRAIVRLLDVATELTPLRAIVVEAPLDVAARVNPASTRTCPRCGTELIERRNRHNGEQFLGCATFPRCRFTKAVTDPSGGIASVISNSRAVRQPL